MYNNIWFQEAIILAIDIGKNSSQKDSEGKTYFEKAIFCASMILKRKVYLMHFIIIICLYNIITFFLLFLF